MTVLAVPDQITSLHVNGKNEKCGSLNAWENNLGKYKDINVQGWGVVIALL